MRIGDILLAEGVIGASDLEAALSEQLVARSWEQAAGGSTASRLGSILYLRGVIPADVIARALARQLGVPAALNRHLEARDPALAAYLPTELARRFVALPVAQTRSEAGLALIVCMRDPSDPAAVELIARAAGMPIIAAVACEAVLAPIVGKVYVPGAPPMRRIAPAEPAPPAEADGDFALEGVDVDFDDSGPVVTAPLAYDELDPLSSGRFTLVELDDRGVARDETQVAPTQSAQRQSGQIAAATGSSLSPESARPAERISASSIPRPPRRDTASPLISMVAALGRIADATHGDEIADAAIEFLTGRWSGAVVLLVRDGLALGHRGFGGALNPAAVEAIVVPLNQPSVLRTAHDQQAPMIGVPTEAGTAQERFLRATGAADRRVVVAPISVGERVVCILFAHGEIPRAGDRPVEDLLGLAHAMGESFLRLIREHKRPRTE